MADSAHASDVRVGGDAALVVALAAGLSNAEAAAQAGVSPRTLGRRMGDPVFRAKVEEAQQEILGRAVRRLCAAVEDAVVELHRLALKGESESTRIRACLAIVQHTPGLLSTVDMQRRLAALEAEQSNGNGRNGS